MRHWIKGLALILLGIVLPAHGGQVGQVSQGIFYQPSCGMPPSAKRAGTR